MKVYTLQETDHNEMMDSLECIVKKAHKLIERLEDIDFGSRYGSRYGTRRDEDDEYDWKIKKGRY